MLKILFKFIDIDENEFRFIWDLNLSNANNINKLLELSDSYSFENFLNKFETISFIFRGKEYKNIGKILEYIVYDDIYEDGGESVINIIEISNQFDKNIEEIINIIECSNTCIISNNNHIYVLEKIASLSKYFNVYLNAVRLINYYNKKIISFNNLEKIILNNGTKIISKKNEYYYYFVPINIFLNKETTEFEKELEKYYNHDVFIFKINQEE